MTSTTQGTGLVLPLSRSLVEAHQGRLELESEVGRGTTVTIILPPSRVIENRGRKASISHPESA